MGIAMFVAGVAICAIVVGSFIWQCLTAAKRVEAEKASRPFDPSLYQLPNHDATRAELKRRTAIPVVFDPVETKEVVLDVKEVPEQCVERLGVLTIDTTTLQVCDGCRAVWLGEYVRSEQCPKCNSKLVAMVAGEAQSQYVIVSEERLIRLCGKLWGREAVGG